MVWLRKPDNPYFARALVNRVWAHYFRPGHHRPTRPTLAAEPGVAPRTPE